MRTERWSIPLLLILGLLSCTSTKPTTPRAPSMSPAVKTPLPKDERGNELTLPEIVRSERVQNDNGGVKTITVGNDKGEYVLSCNQEVNSCITPAPGKDYYVFNKTTKWQFPGATGYLTLAWLQDWSVTYKNGENIALIPTEGDRQPAQIGMYWLSSWRALDKN